MLRYEKLFISTLIFGFLSLPIGFSQNESLLEPTYLSNAGVTPAHMWELGAHIGSPLALGDVDPLPGIGGGIHIRRALGYVFSMRSELLLGSFRNEDTNDGKTKASWQSGTFEIIATLNNMVLKSNNIHKTNFYGIVGVGLNRFKVDVIHAISSEIRKKEYNVQSHGSVGLGFSVRLNERINIGVETKALVLFGNDNDRLDAVKRQEGDVLSYSSLRLNYNIGDKKKKSEPLYWVSPIDLLMQDISELKNRPVFDLTDTDGDGVIDLLDQDNATPLGIQVDTRGLPLDSDGDGIPNHKDAMPYVPSDEAGDELWEEPVATEADVERIVNERLGEYDRTGIVPQPGMEEKGGSDPGESSNLLGENGQASRNAMANWFLPLIHFDIDSYKIRFADYGNLASIAKMMAAEPNLRLVVTGFTDKTSSKGYNDDLSHKRAKSAIDLLVNNHNIERDRLILQYNGEDDPLVPSTGSSLMNRRVEFRAANPNDIEMPAPPPVSVKKNRRKGY